jgi:hypothetical protein
MPEFSSSVIFVVATALFLCLHTLTTLLRKRMGWYSKHETALSRGEVNQ